MLDKIYKWTVQRHWKATNVGKFEELQFPRQGNDDIRSTYHPGFCPKTSGIQYAREMIPSKDQHSWLAETRSLKQLGFGGPKFWKVGYCKGMSQETCIQSPLSCLTNTQLCIHRARLQETQQRAAAGKLMTFADTAATVQHRTNTNVQGYSGLYKYSCFQLRIQKEKGQDQTTSTLTKPKSDLDGIRVTCSFLIILQD